MVFLEGREAPWAPPCALDGEKEAPDLLGGECRVAGRPAPSCPAGLAASPPRRLPAHLGTVPPEILLKPVWRSVSFFRTPDGEVKSRHHLKEGARHGSGPRSREAVSRAAPQGHGGLRDGRRQDDQAARGRPGRQRQDALQLGRRPQARARSGGTARLKPAEPKADPEALARPDLVRRRFDLPVPTTVLCGAITYLRTGEGWLYLASMVDLSTRMVAGWSSSARVNSLAISNVTCGRSVLKAAESCILRFSLGMGLEPWACISAGCMEGFPSRPVLEATLVFTNVRERMLKAEKMRVLSLQAASKCFVYTVAREEPFALTEKLGLEPARIVSPGATKRLRFCARSVFRAMRLGTHVSYRYAPEYDGSVGLPGVLFCSVWEFLELREGRYGR